MNEIQSAERQIISRLKQLNCPQQDCRNNNQDNIDLIVFGNEHAKRTGFMCSQCLMDQDLLVQLKPLGKHCISIKKFMKTLTAKWKQYLEDKSSVNWGPNMLEIEQRQISQLIGKYERELIRGTLQMVSYMQQLQAKTIEQIKVLYKDESFEKLSKLLDEEDFEEIQKTNVSAELVKVSSGIMQWEGLYRMVNEKELKDKQDAIIANYQKEFKRTKEAFQKLIEVQKKVIKQLTNIEAESPL